MQQMILEMVEHFGYLGVALLILLENIFPPIPSEVILTFGGFLSTYTSLTPPLLIIFATIGSLIGAIILYGLGRLLSPQRLKRLLRGRAGRILHFDSDEISLTDSVFRKHGKRTVMLCRCVPIVRSLISIPAGMAGMPFIPFLLFTAIGTVVWNTALIYAGVLAGASWEKIVGACDTYSALVLVAILTALVYLFGALFKRIRADKSTGS